ncbi:hypothetical protein ACLMNJ_29435 [Streptomyces seoulensis]
MNEARAVAHTRADWSEHSLGHTVYGADFTTGALERAWPAADRRRPR